MVDIDRKKICKLYLVVFSILFICVVVLTFLLLRIFYYPMIQITVNDSLQTFQGYNLFAPTVDDIGGELEQPNNIYLMDMNGEIVHTWRVLGAVQLAKLKPNGNLLYSTRDRSFPERAGIREIDLFGNVIWYYKCWADHDFYLLENGNILVHYIEDREVPAIGPGKIRCSRIVEVSPQHDIVWEWRAEEHLDQLTKLVGIRFPLEKEGYKLFNWSHNNTCQVIVANKAASIDSRFKIGNIVFSYCNLNTIGVIDRGSGQIVWAWGPGELDGQHTPHMLRNGHLLIFDNGTKRGYSRIIEFDPISEKILWEYKDTNLNKPRFFSSDISGAQLLSNDNVFVCQGNDWNRNHIMRRLYRLVYERLRRRTVVSSRLFEVNQEGTVVWDCSINLNGKNMYNVYQATRYSTAYLMPLLQKLGEIDGKTKRLKSLPYIR